MKSKLLLGLGIVANTVILFLLSFWLMSLPWLASDEKLMIWATSLVKLVQREVPSSERFALVNTSYDLTLIDRYDEFGFPVGNQAITDRSKLSLLLDIVNSGEAKPDMMFFDILFESQTEEDSTLESELQQLSSHMLSYHLDDNEEPLLPVISGVNIGLSDYVVGNIFEGVYKYQLVYKDSLHLSPLRIYEMLNNVRAEKQGPFVKLGEYTTLNNFIINYRVLQKDIDDLEAGFNPINLGELLLLPDEDIQAYLADKIVVIGDFRANDFHETLFELTAGPLILVNVLLSLESKDTYINWLFFVLLTSAFLYLSYMSLTDKDVIEEAIQRRFGNIAIAKYVAGFASYLGILTLLSITTFFIFNIHLNVFFLACYLYGVDKVNAIIRRRLSA
ncbi:MAG: CHASE2 domain-containing protein [Cyclobacteriaceae bacterium]